MDDGDLLNDALDRHACPFMSMFVGSQDCYCVSKSVDFDGSETWCQSTFHP